MARNTYKNWQNSVKSLFSNRHQNGAASNADRDFDNGKALSWSDAADTTSIPALVVDSDGRVQYDQEARLGCRIPIVFDINANAALGTQSFFTAPIPMTITAIEEIHATAGNDAAAVTMQVTKDTGTQAPGAGVAVQTNSFNLKGTANTTQFATLLGVNGDGSQNSGVQLAAGDRLAAKFTGTLTSLAGVCLTVWVAPGFKGFPAVYNMNANGSLATQTFFEANRDCVVTSVQMYWSAAGTDAGAVTIDVFKDTGTNAPGAGTSVLSAAVSAKTTANTVNNASLTATAATLQLAAGDRLTVKYTGTLTALAGVVVVVWLTSVGSTAYYGQIDPTYTMNANASLATQAFFNADRDYEVVDSSVIWSAAGTDAGAVTIDFTIDKGTAAPGAGTSINTGTINAKGTANTTNVGTPSTSRRNRMLSKGDRLSIKYTGTLTALAGVTATVTLLPR